MQTSSKICVFSDSKYRLQTSFLILSKLINFYFPMKSSENHKLSNSLNIRSEIWVGSLKKFAN